jgi:HK97 family phage portal protein
MGTEDQYQNQVIEPLHLGIKKNTFANSDVEKVSIAVKCCKTLADNIGRLPVNIYQASNAGNEILREDPLYSLLHYSPDGMITANDFFSALEYNRNLRGNAFAKIHRDRASGIPIKLELIPSASVEGYKIVRGQLYYTWYRKLENGENKKEVLNSADMLHFKMTSKNGIWGINPVEAQRLNLSTLYKSKNTQDTFYENNAFSPAFLKSTVPDANFQKPFLEAMKQFKEKNVGPANAGTIATLPPFTEIQQLSMNIIDAQFLASSKYDAQQIAAWYDVPGYMVGLESGTFKNIEEQTRNFATFGLGPITRMYRQELEFKLLTEEERQSGRSIEFVLQALIETDLATKVNYYKSMFGLGVLTGNQIALKEGLPTYEGGNTHYIPSNNMTPVDETEPDTSAIEEEKDI